MTPPSWGERIDQHLAAVRTSGRWRSHRPYDGLGRRGVLADGRRVVDVASNDYLGLASHPAVVAAAHAALDRWGTGAGASRLVTGSRPVHHDLEAEVAAWKGTERAVLLPSGYAANLGVLGALARAGGADTLVVSDELNHASIIDGLRLTKAEVRVTPHADLDAVAAVLTEAAATARPSLVVSDAVFSMDGDAADVAALGALCAARGALLVLDEAHLVWPIGEVPARVEVVRVGTLSKALGSLGGFVAGSAAVCDLVVNLARPQIFSTALPPADVAAALAALRIVRGPEGADLVARLRAHVARVAGGDAASPILPIVVGDEAPAVAASEALLERGFLVPAIRPPTVPAGTSRLRLALSADHTDDEIDGLIAALDALGLRPPPGAAAAQRAQVPQQPAAPPSSWSSPSPSPSPSAPGPPSQSLPAARRPTRVLAVLGTATEVGKTWVGSAFLAEARRRGAVVAARKPGQSFDPADPSPRDADVLAAASGEAPATVCPPSLAFGVALAPPMAARRLGRPPLLLAEVAAAAGSWPAHPVDLGLVEGAGGVASPVAEDGDGMALALAVGADVVLLVADAGLGTIDAVRTHVRPLIAAGLPVVVVLNRYDHGDPLHQENRTWLATIDGFDVTTASPADLGLLVGRLSASNGGVVRAAAPDDATAIAALHLRGWRTAYRGVVPDRHLDGLSPTARTTSWRRRLGASQGDATSTRVVEREGRVEGFATWGPSRDADARPGERELWACYVDPALWGCGVGRLLIDDPAHAGPAVLWVLEDNRRARSAYEALGWVPDGGRKLERLGGATVVEVRLRRPA